MTNLHITSGDVAGNLLAKSGVPGEVLVWHDVLYDGSRKSGWPDEGSFEARAQFLEEMTGGGLSKDFILETLKAQYQRLQSHDGGITLWFDACLFDQAMLCHILACLKFIGNQEAELICIGAFPGIEPFHGLGQLQPEDFASLYHRRQPVTDDQFHFAGYVDQAFALQDMTTFTALARQSEAPLPWAPAAVRRWLQERPDEVTGLGRLEQLALEAVRSGCQSPSEIFKYVSTKETPPQFWGDITLWAKINALADRELVKIEGPSENLPQWEGIYDLKLFRITPIEV